MASAIMDQLLADIKTAMKAQDSETVMTLRTLNAAIKDQTVNAGIEVTDEVVTAVINKAIKQRADAIEQFTLEEAEDVVAYRDAALEALPYRQEE